MLFFITRQLRSKIKFYRDKEVLNPLSLGVRVPYSYKSSCWRELRWDLISKGKSRHVRTERSGWAMPPLVLHYQKPLLSLPLQGESRINIWRREDGRRYQKLQQKNQMRTNSTISCSQHLRAKRLKQIKAVAFCRGIWSYLGHTVSRHCTSGSHYFRHTAFIWVCLKMGCLKFDDHHFPLPQRTNLAQSIFIHFPTHDLSRLDLRPCVFSCFSYAFPPAFFSWFSNASVPQVGLAAKPQIAKAQHGAVSPMDHRLQGNLAAMAENLSGMASIFPQILDKPHLFLAELQDPSNQPPSLRLAFGSYDF